MDKSVLDALMPLFVEGLIAVIGIIVAAVGVEARRVAKNNANNSGFEFITRVAVAGVQAAEQVYGEYNGNAKKQYALEFAERWLAAKGVKVDTETIATAIEAAVLAEFNHPLAQPEAVLPTDVYSPQPGEPTPDEGEEVPVFGNVLDEDARPDTEV